MNHVVTKGSLLPPSRRLLQLMQEVNFGRIEDLAVRNGQPVLDPGPRIVREVKFGGENGPRAQRGAEDFTLKAHVVELFEYLNRMGNGTIEALEIKHGLPFRMIVEDPV